MYHNSPCALYGQRVNMERQVVQPQEATTWTIKGIPSYLEPNLVHIFQLTTFKTTAVPDRRSLSSVRKGEWAKWPELCHWSRGPVLWGQVKKLLTRADLSESLTSAFQMLPGQCIISMCLSLYTDKSKLHSTRSSSLSLSRSVGWAVSCWRSVKE